eukprot:TRINITY_DN3464_c0_g1_i13.p1 TRINITY_DN3464_c0_g1~~TRINITY_DN3464_c0_g1_i13.p1  ORF type:complete len:347 (-),score=81.20 TRINITY_DN3464_c0_g1_i13:257-1297(-)
MFIHGGGWKRGDRKWNTWFARGKLYQNVGHMLARKGYVGVVISYRLSSLSLSSQIILSALVSGISCMLFSSICYLWDYCVSKIVIESQPSFFNLQLISVLIQLQSSYLPQLASTSVTNFFYSYVGLIFLFFFGVVFSRLHFLCEGETEVRHPAHIEDVASAYEWIQNNITQYGGNPSKVFIMGHSAGAHLATLLALDPSYLKNGGHKNIAGVVGISGVYNMNRLRTIPLASHFYLSPLTSDWSEDTLKAMSPTFHARKQKTESGENHKISFPFLLLNAEIDFHLEQDSLELETALKSEKIDVVRVSGVSRHHGSIIASVEREGEDKVSQVILSWLKEKEKEKVIMQ